MRNAINLFKATKIPLLSTAYLIFITTIVEAQTPPPPIIPLPPKPQPVEPETLPPLEEILPELKQPAPNNSNTINDPLNNVFVKKFEIIGSTVFTPEQLAAVLKPYSLRRLSFTELLAAQEAIDRLYFENGYITSGTILPPQKLENGIITIEVVEGSVEEINITGLNRLNAGYVRDRLKIATNAPLKKDKLLNALQLLQLDPLIKNLAAELTAGTRKGSSILELELQEADPFDVTLSFDNFRAAAVGTDRRNIKLTHRNLLGFGDRLSVGYLNTDGSNSLDNLNYTLPINPHNGTLDFRLNYTDSEIITSPFDRFDIESENINYEFTYRQPLIQKPTENVAVGITFAKSNSESTVRGQPAQLSRGAESDGITDTSVIRFFQEYTSRDADEVLAFLSEFSLGINALGATSNDNGQPDSKFLAWRGQAQYLKLLNPTFTLLLRSDLQLANDALVPTEQFSLGGGLNVRGYRQDALLADNGWFNSVEVRATIVSIPKWKTSLQLTPFVDFGAVWNSDDLELEANTLVSTGIGLRLQISDDCTSHLDWGIPLVDLEKEGDSWQEEGIYFSLELKPF
ncbi:MAG: ShlB/FhaC/HecB family hemolysin secretion/activation protein [Waterburya sp.]